MNRESLLTRQALKERWNIGLRTIDRLRQSGKLAWVDISGGRGARPIVRFALADITEFERSVRQCPAEMGDDLSVK
jgi:hypothetical protein